MKLLKFLVMATFMTGFALFINMPRPVTGQGGATEAPAGFDTRTNGFTSQQAFDGAKDTFASVEDEEEGLGPTFNAQGCGNCHLNPGTGGSSHIFERRAGRFDGTNFFPHPGNTLIQSNAINPSILETVLPGNNVVALRSSLTTLGDGFIECIDNNAIVAVRNAQPAAMRGEIFNAPIIEAPGQTRIGRFGWKAQHASLISFAADAYLNEMGITTPFFLAESTSNGRSVANFDLVEDPEDEGEDVELFALFMRSTKVPPRDTALAATADAVAGSAIFDQLGCNVCHVRNFTTMAAGTSINGGQFVVPPALGNKIIHPFSDFMLHNLGDPMDGIQQEGMPASTRNKMRTPPLWGLRMRPVFMHDGASNTLNAAILRHAGEATSVTNAYRARNDADKNRLFTFLRSL